MTKSGQHRDNAPERVPKQGGRDLEGQSFYPVNPSPGQPIPNQPPKPTTPPPTGAADRGQPEE